MATQSSEPSPANPAHQNPENVQPTTGVQQGAGAEAIKQSPPSVFVNSEPMREEQVQNAVKFLSHPKVRGSPVMYRRSFLEKKGLTKEEIDEAFRRVPDPTPNTQATSSSQEGQVKATPNAQPPAPAQTLQPVAAAPTGVISTMRTLTQHQFNWHHAVVAVGLLAVSGAGTAVLVKKTIIPRLKSWIRKVVLEEEDDSVMKTNAKLSLAEEAAAAAKAAAAAAADVARASQEMLNSENEEKRCFKEFMNMLDVQVQEMKSMSTAIHRLEGQIDYRARNSLADQEDYRASVANPKQTYTNGKAEFDLRSGRSSSQSMSAQASVAAHRKSYMEIMEQRGEKPANIRDINDQLPNPYQQISNPRIASITKPWEVGRAQNNSSQVLESQVGRESLNSNVHDSGVDQLDGKSMEPRWQQKNARITEIENGDETKAGPFGVQTSEQPVRRAWVPPQPPPVVMPEAAEAIRRPKQSIQKEQSEDDQSVSHPIDTADELQRITKISESGGAVEINGGGSVLNSSEIQEEQEQIHEN
ncbi:PREDICTED: peroxisomal membrane protein PEX14 isoform X2 [Populus euphratica]|uniref:Peroxisomal membrane protein PEX14 n=1 Tax=Populus euphratica TaxID=75702 RepID=A0AAJ6UGT2_POPEU|nr:PREDICTED: peroxisomal membrane protein PEX14 isoform X2 [Populus euphratica]